MYDVGGAEEGVPENEGIPTMIRCFCTDVPSDLLRKAVMENALSSERMKVMLSSGSGGGTSKVTSASTICEILPEVFDMVAPSGSTKPTPTTQRNYTLTS